ncbi:MAG: hypothetical protein DRQ55_04620 [Planctomycetota bacterium]|nr:MAG: hypothetical protein DRQ55_04620 [Planctomycetota bacterium]
MRTEHQTPPGPAAASSASAAGVALESLLLTVGTTLGETLGDVLGALPGAPHRPSDLTRALGVNRSVASRLLGALGKGDPRELLHLVPGPEPLRNVVLGARRRGASAAQADAALAAIDEFDQLIRKQAGTRPALDALISANLPGARERFELASKYSVFKGMSQLKGVQAEHWLGVAVVAPCADDPERHDLTWLNGALAMQRLRPGAAVRFGYRHRGGESTAKASPPPMSVTPLDAFCMNPPARLESHITGDTIQYTLPADLLGPNEVVDMFVVDHHPGAMRRLALDVPRHRNSLFVEPAVPVASMLFDVILHDDAFPGCEPELLVYDTGYDGIANVNDAARDLDRVDMAESVRFMGHDMGALEADEIPTYHDMLMHLAERYGWQPERFRTWRLRMRYPVYGWQVCLSFEPAAGGEPAVG